jgi:hypothetical protein
MSVIKKLGLLIVLSVGFSGLWAQTTLSPYSTLGLGEFYGNGLANNQGMAGVGVAHPQYWYGNNTNPALLIYNTLTVFQAGMVAERRNIKSDSVSEATKRWKSQLPGNGISCCKKQVVNVHFTVALYHCKI